MPAPRRLLTDLGCGGVPRQPCAFVGIGTTGRGPLLLISGQEDRLVPDSVTCAVCKPYGDLTAVTDLKQFADAVMRRWSTAAGDSSPADVLGRPDEHGIRALPEER